MCGRSARTVRRGEEPGNRFFLPLSEPLINRGIAPPVMAGSVGAIMAQFKSIVTKRINAIRETPRAPVWQRITYEHVIRNQADLTRMRQYIADNPAIDRRPKPSFDIELTEAGWFANRPTEYKSPANPESVHSVKHWPSTIGNTSRNPLHPRVQDPRTPHTRPLHNPPP